MMKDLIEGIVAIVVVIVTMIAGAVIVGLIMLMLTAPFWFIPLTVYLIVK